MLPLLLPLLRQFHPPFPPPWRHLPPLKGKRLLLTHALLELLQPASAKPQTTPHSGHL